MRLPAAKTMLVFALLLWIMAAATANINRFACIPDLPLDVASS